MDMSLTLILNVLLGLTFTWFLLSLAAMNIQEWLASRSNWRSRMLEKTIGKMLADIVLVDQFYNHPTIRSLYTGTNNAHKPSYIPTSQFSQVMIDLLTTSGTEASLIQEKLYQLYSKTDRLPRKKRQDARERLGVMLGMTRKALIAETGEDAVNEILKIVKSELLVLGENIPQLQKSVEDSLKNIIIQKQQIDAALVKMSYQGEPSKNSVMNQIRAGVMALSVTHPQLKQTLYPMLYSMPQTVVQKGIELELVRTNLEEWFNNNMDRLTGWYKRRTMVSTFLIGILIAIVANVDSINLTTRLWREPDLRVAILNKLEAILIQDNTSTLSSVQFLTIQQQFSDISLPVGWVGSPVSLTSAQPGNGQQTLPETCMLYPNKENEIYGLLVSGRCYRFINIPQLTDMTGWLIKLLGILITGGAGSQGASFWFDVLKKIMNVRFSGLKPAETNQMVG
jgi:hypothetical protein